MTSIEWRATIGLASVYALRMLGLFMVLPAFAPHAQALEGARDALLVGLALGIYGLTQALCQIPFGMASDRYGRKPVIILGMLIFAAGSWLAGQAQSIEWLIAGRALQGAGAISAAVAALLADVTRPQVRTMAMAILGVGMGLSFVVALVAGPPVAGVIGVDGILRAAAWLSLLAIAVVAWVVPTAPRQLQRAGGLGAVIGNAALWQLHGGIFLLHALLTASFVMLPALIADRLGLAVAAQWRLYLPIMLGALMVVLPLIRWAERSGRLRPVYVSAIAGLALACGLFAASAREPLLLVLAAGVYFTAFNYLEGALPSLVSRLAPAEARGAALGLYATSQFLGAFAGGLVGGGAVLLAGGAGGFLLLALLPLIWLAFAHRLRPPQAATPHT